MEVIQSENVKVPNSVLVGGLTGDVIDNEVMEYLVLKHVFFVWQMLSRAKVAKIADLLEFVLC